MIPNSLQVRRVFGSRTATGNGGSFTEEKALKRSGGMFLVDIEMDR